MFTEALHDWTAVLKGSSAKEETAKSILDLSPSRNSVSREDESGNAQATPTNEPGSVDNVRHTNSRHFRCKKWSIRTHEKTRNCF
jgi:hypothetical protein